MTTSPSSSPASATAASSPMLCTARWASSGGRPRVIVVDDGSADPRRSASTAGLPDGVELLRRPRGGVAAARNAGAAAADTPYLLMLDADDRLRPAPWPRCGPARGRRRAGLRLRRRRVLRRMVGPAAFPDYDPYRLLYRSIVTATSLIRRELFECGRRLRLELPGYEDWDFYLGALRARLDRAGGARGRVRLPPPRRVAARHRPRRLPPPLPRHPGQDAALYARAAEFAAASRLAPPAGSSTAPGGPGGRCRAAVEQGSTGCSSARRRGPRQLDQLGETARDLGIGVGASAPWGAVARQQPLERGGDRLRVSVGATSPAGRRARSGRPRCSRRAPGSAAPPPRYSNSLPVASPRRVPAVKQQQRVRLAL